LRLVAAWLLPIPHTTDPSVMMKAVRQLASRALGEKPVLTLDDSADGSERRFRAEPCAHQVAANPRESAVASLDDLSKHGKNSLVPRFCMPAASAGRLRFARGPNPFVFGESA